MIDDYVMRAPCAKCGCTRGRIEEKGAQDVVRCAECNVYAYCAPRAETGKPKRSLPKTRTGIRPTKRAEVLMRDGGKCAVCGCDGDARELHVGHLLSLHDGRKQGFTDDELNSIENLAAMCDLCNLGLGAETVSLWLFAGILRARLARAARLEAAE